MSARRRVAPLLGAAALGLLAVLPVAAQPPPSTESPQPSPTAPPKPTLPLAVHLGGITPLAPQPTDTLVVTGTLRNVSTTTVSDLDVSLRYGSNRIGSRSEFDDYAAQPNGTLPPNRAGAATLALARTSLRPRASETFTLKVPVDSLGLDKRSWQVYEIGVQVVGLTPAGTQTVGRLRTFLPWAPLGVPGVGLPTRVAWVWPLVDTPHRIVGRTFADDTLGTSFASGGRLYALLHAGLDASVQQTPPAKPRTQRQRQQGITPKQPPKVTPVPVTWAVDPMLVQDALDMGGGYPVNTNGKTTSGVGAKAARFWLAGLRDGVSRGELLALPYADPDIVAAVRSGLGAEVQVSINAGQTLLSSALSSLPLSYAWPPSGLTDQHTLDTLFAAGVRTVVLSDAALPIVGGAPNETPGTHAIAEAHDGKLDALLVDGGLGTIVADGVAAPDRASLDVQRYLAETLMIQAELPSDQRTEVIAPDRRWMPSAAYADALIADTGKVPWIAPVSLSTAASSPVSTKVTRGPVAYTRSDRRAELSPDYLAAVRAIKGRADAFGSILIPGDPQAREYDQAILRTLSSAWRSDDTTASERLDAVSTSLATTMGRVRIATAPGSFVTLTSHSGTVPVTVSNELDTPVRVVVGISSQHLKLSGTGRTAESIPPHRQIPIDVKATAQTSGVFRLDVALYTPTGQVYQRVRLFVRSTAYGTVALLITGGATAVLMVAVVVRLVRRGMRARRRVATASR